MNINNDREKKNLSTSDESMTVNTLLSYVEYALSKAAKDNLITALNNEFRKEVSEAKDILWKVVGDVVLVQFRKRTDSPNVFNNCTDILDSLRKLNQESKQLSYV